MNCALSTSRVLFYILNVIFGLLGLCILGYGLYGIAAGNGSPKLQNVIAIIEGILMILAFTLGCFGIHRASVEFMLPNIIIIGIVIILQIVALIRLYSQDIAEVLTTLAENAWNMHRNGSNEMAIFEKQFECCGLHGYNDYATINQSIPPSCYKYGSQRYNIGCFERLQEIANDGVKVLKIGSWILVVFEGFLLFFAIVMANHYRNIRKVPRIYN